MLGKWCKKVICADIFCFIAYVILIFLDSTISISKSHIGHNNLQLRVYNNVLRQGHTNWRSCSQLRQSYSIYNFLCLNKCVTFEITYIIYVVHLNFTLYFIAHIFVFKSILSVLPKQSQGIKTEWFLGHIYIYIYIYIY